MKLSRLLILPLIAILASCSSHRQNLPYFNGVDLLEPVETGDYLPRIEPSDELMITVVSKNSEGANNYNLPYVNSVVRETTLRQTSPEQQTYTVDSEGYISFPILGRIYVKGMTTEELRDLLTKRISEDLLDPIVTVNLVRYVVNLGGEVVRPGRYYVYTPRYTLLDALASAGDLTQYGRRDNVLLVREEDGKRTYHRINLNSADIFNSPYFYLKQNDYIYVEPNDVRKDNAEYSQYYSYKLSVVSTIVGASASIISLIIALTR